MVCPTPMPTPAPVPAPERTSGVRGVERVRVRARPRVEKRVDTFRRRPRVWVWVVGEDVGVVDAGAGWAVVVVVGESCLSLLLGVVAVGKTG